MPVTVKQLGELGNIDLLHEEMGLGPSTLAGAGWAPDEHRDARVQAAIAQLLHFRNRPGHGRDERLPVEEVLGGVGRQLCKTIHPTSLL